MIYVGIDPGLDGALAVIDPNRSEVMVWDTPTLPHTPEGAARVYRESMMRAMVLGLARRVPSTLSIECVLESVHSMPGQGVRSMFSMGHGFGLWRGMLAMADIPYKLVTPQVWKRHHGLLKTDKEASRALAIRLFPGLEPLLKRKRDHGRAEALLMAAYARKANYVGKA